MQLIGLLAHVSRTYFSIPFMYTLQKKKQKQKKNRKKQKKKNQKKKNKKKKKKKKHRDTQSVGKSI